MSIRSGKGHQQPASEQKTPLSIYADKLLAAFGPLTDRPQIPRAKGPLWEGHDVVNPIEPLSDRDREVLQLVATGLSNSQIAARLIVTTGTVKTHINHIFGKLGVQSRTQAVARARELGLLMD
jgi:LuxR family maltose regulon positive regulatory protein